MKKEFLVVPILTNYLVFFTTLLLEVGRVASGHIYSWDVAIEYQNAGEARYFTIFFSLESGLPSGNQIQIDFPKEVTAAGLASSCLLGSVALPLTAGCSISSLTKSLIVTTSANLNPNEWYQLRVEVENVAAQTEGFQGALGMSTQSTGTFKIKYDSNSAIAVYQLAPKPIELLEVAQSNPAGISDRLKGTLGQANEYYFDIKPKVTVPGGSKWTIMMDRSDFLFTSTCSSQALNCASTDTICEAIALVEGVCSVDPSGLRITFLASKDIVADKKLRLKAVVRNPTYFTSAGGYYISSESKTVKLYFEKRSFKDKLIVRQISIPVPVVKYLWGTPSSEGKSFSRCKIGFFKSGPQYKVFNNFIMELKIPVTPVKLNLKLSVLLPQASFSLLLSSVSTTIPTFPTKVIDIKKTSSALEIWNVGPLTDAGGKVYEIRGRCFFGNDFTTTTFGAIKVEALSDVGVEISQIGQSDGASIQILQNYEYTGGSRTLKSYDYHHASNVNKIGYVFVSTKLGSADYTNADSADLLGAGTEMRAGIPLWASKKVQALLFTIYPGPEHICCSGAQGTCEQSTLTLSTCSDSITPYLIMLGMVANSAIIKTKTESGFGVQILDGFWGNTAAKLKDTCTPGGTYTQYGKASLCNYNIMNDWVKEDAYNIAHLKLNNLGANKGYITRGESQALYPAAFVIREDQDGTGIFQTSKDLPSQLYGGQQVLDFIVCFNFKQNQASVTEEGLLLASQSLLNTFIIQKNIEPYLTIKFVNYIRQSSEDLNYAVPVFLRVYGTLAEDVSGTTMSLFLDDQLDIGTFTEGNCVSSIVGVNCDAYPESQHVSYSNVNFRQRIDLVGANPSASAVNFDYYIPVKTVEKPFASDPKTIFIDFGVLAAAPSDSRFFKVVSIYRVYGYPWGPVTRIYPFSSSNPSAQNAITIGQSSTGQTQSKEKSCSWGEAEKMLPIDDPLFDPGYIFTSGIELLIKNSDAPCLGRKSDANLLNTGVVFAHRSLDLVGSAEVKWDFADNLLCKKFSFFNDALTAISIGFLCVLTNTLSEPQPLLDTNSKIKLSSFQVPWTWGQFLSKPDLDVHISVSYKGENAGYYSHTKFSAVDTNFATGCTSTNWSPLSRNTKSQLLRFTFSPSAGIDLLLTPEEEFSLKIMATPTLASSGWGELRCSIILSTGEPMQCSLEYPFIVLRTKADSVKSLAKSTHTINYFGNQDSTVISDKSVYLEIHYKRKGGTRLKIDSCDQAQPKLIPAASSEDAASLSLEPPIYTLTKAARTSFSFNFGVSGTNRLLWKGSTFEFNLGWFGDKLPELGQNLHCFPKQGDQLSFLFSDLDLNSPSIPKLTIGSESPLGRFTLYCNGAISPSLSSAVEMKFLWKDGSYLIGETSSSSTIKPPSAGTLQETHSDLIVSLENKLFNTAGFEATYVFNATPRLQNYTRDSRIYIDFNIDIPPRGNRAGNPSCQVEGNEAQCDFIDERSLSVWLPLDLPWKPERPYQIIVRKIAQPNAFASVYKKIAVTFDLDNNRLNGVSEWGYVDEIASAGSVPGSLSIISYTTTSSITRFKADISITMRLPIESVVKDALFYIQLPPYWGIILPTAASFRCVLFKIADANSTDFVNNCTIQKDYRIKLYTNLDLESSKSNIYSLKILDLVTPQQPTSTMPAWITVFQTSSDERSVLKTTAPGYTNASHFVFLNKPNQQYPVWFNRISGSRKFLNPNDYLEVYVGLYRTTVFLGYQDDKITAFVSYDVTFSGDAINNIIIWPEKPKVVFGEKEQSLIIAAKAGVVPGKYILLAQKSGDDLNINSLIPNLPILIKKEPCQVNTMKTSYKIPPGGVTTPILFDFSSCMPLTDIEIIGEVNSTEKYNISFVQNNNAETVKSIKFTFQGFSQTKLNVFLFCNNASQEVGKRVVIDWIIAGTDRLYFSKPLSTSIETIDPAPFKTTPAVKSFSATPSAGKVVLTISCSSFGNYFWAIGLNRTVDNLTLSYIKSKTLDAKLQQTSRDPNDLNWIVMGYGDQIDLSQNSVEISNPRAGGLYNATAYCNNQLFLESNKSTIDSGWNQTDNLGRVAKVVLNFTSKITEGQATDVACALTQLLGLPPTRIRTESNSICSRFRVLQQNTSSTSKTNSSSSIKISFSIYSWFLIPDVSIPSSTAHLTLKEYYDKPNFVDLVMSRTSRGASSFGSVLKAGLYFAQSIIPPLGYLNATSQIVADYKWIYFNTSIILNNGFLIVGARVLKRKNSNANPVYDPNPNKGITPIAPSANTSNSSTTNSTKNSSLVITTPSKQQLRNRLDSSDQALASFMCVYSLANSTIHINMTGLENSTTYQLYVMHSNEDPGPDALYGEIGVFEVSTIDPNEIIKLSLNLFITCLLIFVLTVI